MRPFCRRRYDILGPGGVQGIAGQEENLSTTHLSGGVKAIRERQYIVFEAGGFQGDMVESTMRNESRRSWWKGSGSWRAACVHFADDDTSL